MYSDYEDDDFDDEQHRTKKRRVKTNDSGDDDDVEDDSENEESSSSGFEKYVSDRGSESGGEETDYDEENPYHPPPKSPLLNPKQQKKRRNYYDESQQLDETTPDRISSLPKSVLIHILSFLPIKYVVRTSALSKKWNPIWTGIENANFVFHSDNNYGFDEDDRIKAYIRFVDRALVTLGHFEFKKFSFELSYIRRLKAEVKVWVQFMFKKKIPEIDLNLYSPQPGHRFVLPQCVFENSDLVKFTVTKCKFKPKTVDWKSLKVLTIKSTQLTPAVIRKILEGSPVLEYLELYRCWFYTGGSKNELVFRSASLKKLVIHGYKDPSYDSYYHDIKWKISAPNVSSLEIKGCLGIRMIELVKMKLVIEAKIDYNQYNYDEFKENTEMINGFLNSLKHVQQLTLGSYCIQALTIARLKRLASKLSKCKSLRIETKLDKWYLPGISRVLRCSPKADSLLINLDSVNIESDWYEIKFGSEFCKTHEYATEGFWESQKGKFQPSLLQLKTVKVVGINKKTSNSELENALSLLKFLLEKSSLLENLTISAGKFKLEPEFLNFSQRLSSFEKSSPNSLIVFT